METKELPSYPEMNRIALLYPGPQIMLGQEIYWTEKRDGSQLRIAWVDGRVQVSTHHQDEASEQFQTYFLATDQAPGVISLLKDSNGLCENPTANFNTGAVIFGELLVKGKSPARFEVHEKHEFVIFDIWNRNEARFISYTTLWQQAFHYGLPVVECWARSQHQDLESLYAYKDKMLEIAKEKKREGVVLKCYHSQLFAKEKLDTPVIQRVHIEDGTPRLPALQDSEVMGAIAKAHTDLGELIKDKALAMPLIARYVGEESKKHLCSKPAQSLFNYYLEYIKEVS